MALVRRRQPDNQQAPQPQPQRSRQERDPYRVRRGGSFYSWFAIGLASTALATCAYSTGGNEHGINHYGPPLRNTMPSYPVEVPRDPDTFVLPQARQFGALVCPQVVVLKTKEGVVQAIHNPVVENPNDALPLIFVGADGHGARFDRIRAGDFAAITFLDSDGSKDDNNRPHDCDRTTVRVIQAVDARNPANKSYVLVGQDSSLQDGDRVVPSEQAAGTYDLISYAVDLVPTDPRQAYLRPAGQ